MYLASISIKMHSHIVCCVVVCHAVKLSDVQDITVSFT